MTTASPVYAAKLRLAEHYVNVVRDADCVFEQGGEGNLTALARFDADRAQIAQWRAWLAAQADQDHTAAALLVALTHNGQHLLSKRLAFPEIRAWYEVGLAAAEGLGDLAATASHLRWIGFAQFQLGQFESGQALMLEALASAERSGQPKEVANTLNLLKFFDFETGKLDAAVETSLRALDLYQQMGDAKGSTATLALLGWISIRKGEWQPAEAYLRSARELALRLGDQSLLCDVFRYYGALAKGTGAYADATEYNEHALDLALRIGDQTVALSLMINQGANYDNLGDYAAGRAVNLRALSMARRGGFARYQSVILNNLGYSAYLQGDFAEAVGWMEESMGLLRAQQQTYNVCVGLANLIPAYLPLGRYAEARTALHEGLELALNLDVDALKATMVVAAVQTWVKVAQDSATDEERCALLDAAAYWSGMIISCPGAEQENRDEIAKLRPYMEGQLGEVRFKQHLKQGGQMYVDEVIKEILVVLGDGAGASA